MRPARALGEDNAVASSRSRWIQAGSGRQDPSPHHLRVELASVEDEQANENKWREQTDGS